LNWKKLQKN